MKKLKNSELNRIDISTFKSIKKTPLIIILDDIRSLNNIGSIFRTCDAFKIEKIYLCGITATPPNRKITKTAIGATESIDWEYYENINNDYFFFVDDWHINFDTSLKKINNHFKVTTTKGFGISKNNQGLISASMILHYLEDSHKKDLSHIKKLTPINENSCLIMDAFVSLYMFQLDFFNTLGLPTSTTCTTNVC